ncbi:MAG: hypothetical protein M0P10_03815 [Sphaerochaetaceae bacterium]|nr:hypothetical protein [Sphaerochaetaceae bacterium]
MKKLITSITILTIAMASIFAAESRSLDFYMHGALPTVEPTVSLKYDSQYIEDNDEIDAFDFSKTYTQSTQLFKVLISPYDTTQVMTLTCDIQIGDFYLYKTDSDGEYTTEIIDVGPTPTLDVYPIDKYEFASGSQYTDSHKAFDITLPEGKYTFEEDTVATFRVNVTPEDSSYIAGSYRSLITLGFTLDY